MTPYAKSQVAFDRYAEPLGLALLAYPGVLKWEVSGSVESFAARFREAKNAGLEFGYTHSRVNPRSFREYGPSLVVAMRTGYVLIGPSSSIKAYEYDPNSNKPQPDPGIEVDISDMECATALCHLIRAGAFKHPIPFTVGPLSQEFATKLELQFGVTLTPIDDKPHCYTLL